MPLRSKTAGDGGLHLPEDQRVIALCESTGISCSPAPEQVVDRIVPVRHHIKLTIV